MTPLYTPPPQKKSNCQLGAWDSGCGCMELVGALAAFAWETTFESVDSNILLFPKLVLGPGEQLAAA